MKREDILAIYEVGPEAAIKLVNSLMATITELERAAKDLEKSARRL